MHLDSHLDHQYKLMLNRFLYLSVLTYYYGELNCDRLHILITFVYSITSLLTSTHKPVLVRNPSNMDTYIKIQLNPLDVSSVCQQ